jgi:flagellar secretion chaperone FliS
MTAQAERMEAMRTRYLREAVETSTPAGRLVMLLDALEMDLGRADKAFADKADIKTISDLLIHAQSVLMVLRDTLDTSSWEPATRLWALYDYLHNELVHANLQKDRDRAAAVAIHVTQLAAAWRKAAADASQPAALVS